MGKDEIWAAIEALPRGAKADLARHLKLEGYNISKMFRSDRELRQGESEEILSWLKERQEQAEGRSAVVGHKKVTVALREIPTVDSSESVQIPLWTVAPGGGDGRGGPMSIARTPDTVAAPDGLKHPRTAFSIEVWDDANDPGLPRGTTIYVNRSTGRDKQWHIFGRPVGNGRSALQGAVLGILLAKRSDAWLARIGIEDADLSFADYPVAWQVRQIHY